jgi:hypothetical protein
MNYSFEVAIIQFMNITKGNPLGEKKNQKTKKQGIVNDT